MTPTRGQRGFTLLESLVSIMLTSLVIFGLAAALLAGVRSSEVAARTQRADSALSSFTESLKTLPYPVAAGSCPTLTEFQDEWAAYPAAWVAPSDVSVAITEVEHWQPSGTDAGSYATACPAEGDPHVHRLRVEVIIDDKRRGAQVVVGQP